MKYNFDFNMAQLPSGENIFNLAMQINISSIVSSLWFFLSEILLKPLFSLQSIHCTTRSWLQHAMTKALPCDGKMSIAALLI